MGKASPRQSHFYMSLIKVEFIDCEANLLILISTQKCNRLLWLKQMEMEPYKLYNAEKINNEKILQLIFGFFRTLS